MVKIINFLKKDPRSLDSSDILESFDKEEILKTLREYMVGKILMEEKMIMMPKTYVCWRLRKKLNKALFSLDGNIDVTNNQ